MFPTRLMQGTQLTPPSYHTTGELDECVPLVGRIVACAGKFLIFLRNIRSNRSNNNSNFISILLTWLHVTRVVTPPPPWWPHKQLSSPWLRTSLEAGGAAREVTTRPKQCCATLSQAVIGARREEIIPKWHRP